MKIYACPAELPWEPDYANYDFKKEQKREQAHQAALEAHLRKMGYNGKNTGSILRVPFADGAAQYMFMDGSKCGLVHLPYGDAWNAPDVRFLPKKEVLRRLDSAKKINAIFAAKENA